MTTKSIDNKKVKLSEKLGFLFFSTSNNIIYNFKGAYYLLFLTNVLYLPIGVASTILTLGIIWDAINDPLIGYWSMNHVFKSGEKIRPLILYFAFPWAITIVLLFTNFNLNQMLTAVVCFVIYFFYEAFNTFLAVPYNSMATVSSSDDEDRKSINAYRSLGGSIGSGIGFVAPLLIIQFFGGLPNSDSILGPSDAIPLLKTAILMGVLCVVGCLVHYFTCKERVHQVSDNNEKIGFVETFKMLFSIKPWVLNMLFILCYGIDTDLVMDTIGYYAAYVLGASAKALPIEVLYLVVAIISAFVVGKIDKKIGRKNTMILAAVIQIVTKIPFIINPFSMVTIFINAFGVGFGGTAAFIMFNTNRNNISDMVEFKFGRRADSMVATCDNLITKLAEALAIKGMGTMLDIAGMDATLGMNQPDSAIRAICALLGWIPLIVTIFMAFFAYKNHLVADYNNAKKAYESK